jgi:hypothetical protein
VALPKGLTSLALGTGYMAVAAEFVSFTIRVLVGGVYLEELTVREWDCDR